VVPSSWVSPDGHQCNFSYQYGNFYVGYAQARLDAGYCDSSGTGFSLAWNGNLVAGNTVSIFSYHTWYQSRVSPSVFIGEFQTCDQLPYGQTNTYFCVDLQVNPF